MRNIILAVSFTFMSLWVTPTWAFLDIFDIFDDKHKLAASAKITLQEAVSTAVNEVPGKIIEAEIEEEDGRPVYEIDVLTDDGRVKELHVDAMNGQVIKMNSE